jgi:cell division protein FtsB
MNLKFKIGMALVFCLAVFAAGFNFYLFTKEKARSTRLQSDIRWGYEQGFQIIDSLKAKNGQLVARNNVLELTSKELRSGIAQDVIRQLDNLGIKPKHVTNYSETVVRHEKEIVTRLRDSVIFDTVPVSCFNYSDHWYDVSGYSEGDQQHLKISSLDSLVQVIYRGQRYNFKGKKRPGCFFWVPRRLEQVITSDNPSSKIIYSKTISISK